MKLERILHVDDSDDMREISKVALETIGGFELHQFSTGQSAIHEIRALRPDLLLLDVMMPKLSGPDVYERVKMIPGFEEIPTIFLTVKAQDTFAKSLRESGAIGVIAKPFDPMSLAMEIKGLWNERAVRLSPNDVLDDEKVIFLPTRQRVSV